jgi:hypothetical protein
VKGLMVFAALAVITGSTAMNTQAAGHSSKQGHITRTTSGTAPCPTPLASQPSAPCVQETVSHIGEIAGANRGAAPAVVWACVLSVYPPTWTAVGGPKGVAHGVSKLVCNVGVFSASVYDTLQVEAPGGGRFLNVSVGSNGEAYTANISATALYICKITYTDIWQSQGVAGWTWPDGYPGGTAGTGPQSFLPCDV